MTLSVSIRGYRLGLTKPFGGARGGLRERQGWILLFRNEAGVEGMGEVAPVHWLEDACLEEVRDSLKRLPAEVAALRSIPLDSPEDCGRLLASLRASGPLPRAVRGALESACLDLVARERGIAVCELLDGSCRRAVAIGTLIAEAAAVEVEQAVASAADRGVRSVKLKVGALPAEQDAERVTAALRASRGRARVVLDANAAWSPADAATVLSADIAEGVDYVEEPLANPTPASLRALHERTGVVIAIDESFERLGGLDGVVAAAAGVLVLKPARVGGPLRTATLAGQARERGLRTILTDAIETRIGQAAVVHTAALVPSSETIGLGGRALADGSLALARPSLDPLCVAAVACGPGMDVRPLGAGESA